MPEPPGVMQVISECRRLYGMLFCLQNDGVSCCRSSESGQDKATNDE